MILKIRNGIFETNSSSTHAIVFDPYAESEDKHLTEDVDLIYRDDFTSDLIQDGFFCAYSNLWEVGEFPAWVKKFMYFYFRICQNFPYRTDMNRGFLDDTIKASKFLKDLFRRISGVNVNMFCEVIVYKEDLISINDGYITCIRGDKVQTFRLMPKSRYEKYIWPDQIYPELYDVDDPDSSDDEAYTFFVYESPDLKPISELYLMDSLNKDIALFEERDSSVPDWVYLQIIEEYIRNDSMKLDNYSFSAYDGEYYEFFELARRIYTNGNFYTCMFGDGTRIIMSQEDVLIPEFPLSIDLKITDKCKNGCPYCYESSTPDGEDADEGIIGLLKALPPYVEVTLGGGNPLESGLLKQILAECNLNISFTINQADLDSLMSDEWFKELTENHGLPEYSWQTDLKATVTAIGISVSHVDNVLIEKLKKLDEQIHVVVHAAAGVITMRELKKLYDHDLRLLILGYKSCGRGAEYISRNVKRRIRTLSEHIDEMRRHFRITAFDNLALRQLNVKRLVSENGWEKLYQGEEGELSMYIDGVKGEFTASSYSGEMHTIKGGMSIKDMFLKIRNERNGSSF